MTPELDFEPTNRTEPGLHDICLMRGTSTAILRAAT